MAERMVIVRHGETEWSRSLRHTGRTDVPLTDHGRQQAAEVGAKMADIRFSLVLCSPLDRARETCRLAGFGSQAEIDDRLHEWDYGDYEGLTTEEIRQTRPDWNLWRDGCPGGEAPVQIGDRADSVLAGVDAVDGDVLVFAHGHMLRVLTARWCELEVAAGARFKLAAAAIGVLGHERETRVIERWSV